MSIGNQGQPRGPIEPFFDVVHEGVDLGYQALELVAEGLRESLRLQAGGPPGTRRRRSAGARRRSGAAAQDVETRPHLQAGSPRSGQTAQPKSTVGDLATVFAEFASRAGAAAQEAASSVSGQRGAPHAVPELTVEAPAGASSELEFLIWNTGPTVLRGVNLIATQLVGCGSHLPDAISFDPATVDRIGPGKAEPVKIVVHVPDGVAAGTYRALVHADPGDTSAVLELRVPEPSDAAPGQAQQA